MQPGYKVTRDGKIGTVLKIINDSPYCYVVFNKIVWSMPVDKLSVVATEPLSERMKTIYREYVDLTV